MEEPKLIDAGKIVDDAIDVANIVIGQKENVMSGLFKFIKISMEYVEDIQGLTGREKKDLVIEVVHELIDRDEGPLDRFDDIIKPLVEGAIEQFIEVGHNGIKLNVKKPKWCFKWCSK